MKEYKPIMVVYLDSRESNLQHELQDIYQKLDKVRENTGYEIIVLSIEGQARVEIISVDKATVVEDIQKYIDLKIENRQDSSEAFIPDIDTTTYQFKEFEK